MHAFKLILLAGLGLASLPAAALAQDLVTIPRVGTQPLPSTADDTIPLDKPWGKLTPAQQAIVRSWYDGLSASDEPPYPIDGLQAIFSEITKVQAAVPVAGAFYAAAHVDARGKADRVTIYELPDPRLKDVLSFILIKTEYKPARCSGKPCEMDFPIQAGFERPNAPAAPPAAASPTAPN